MPYASALLLLAAVYLAVLASPGPNFFILSQLSLDGRQRDARWTVLGLVTGSVLWVVLAMAGLSALLATHPLVATTVRLLGAAYLVWYGAMLLRSAWPSRVGQQRNSPRSLAATPSAGTAYRVGLMTGLTNPKGAVFWTSAFATLLPAVSPVWFKGLVVLMVLLLSLGWHLGITLVFGLPALRQRYLRLERAINGVAGGALVLLGVQRVVGR